ncbi:MULTISPECIES: histidine phosphatase family protein [unclassified Halomonas]|uniref:histidine phosphatase family protein n=1 Tax=unclassified Halomonas TaxID=2609666 RepID=UPI001CF1388C|nr:MULTISPECIES: histidine phosphatase family protein [unclassified Halomonas]MCA8866303.1 histidine phosphatase family protein [Halomonas sp. SBBP1]UZH09871.1 histidine phosphatase family protein [Halomonas sp. BDJS001]
MSNTLQPLSDHWRNRYLLMRHGHSQANQQGVIVSSPERGIENFGLSEYGEQQLAQLVADWQWPVPTRVVHSDFLRTRQTAAHVAARFGLVPSVDTRLRERHFGELEGQGDDRYPSIWALDAEDAEHRHYQVETLCEVASRMQAVIAAWEQQASGETILLVSHGDPLQILLTALANKPLTQHREQPALLPASVTLIGG